MACLSPIDEATVRGMFMGQHEVEVVLVPEPPAQAAVAAACAGADLVIADRRHRHRIDRTVLAGMHGCKLIQAAAVGFDTIDHRAAAELGIPVANAAGYNKDSVADWTVMAMIALIRRSFWGDRQLRAGRWTVEDQLRGDEMMGRELGALTVGIVGFGNVGSAVARRVAAFGSRILFADVVPLTFDGAQRVDLDTLLRRSDIVSIHSPLDHDTRALIDASALSKMKRGGYLINAARGPIVDEAALVDALRAGHLGGAALDVFEVEPLPTDSPLRSFDNVILAPHRGGATLEAEVRLIEVVGENLRRVLDGLPPRNIVNGVEVKMA
ncbi:MAG TPA: 2-hydroxyacid dehydrogenase [Candidatus Dormibacteraeota bacterium]|nr:2-hydroxyacid dehydrogenase [Candidatus Dormibacteraeota bacterium]